VLCTSCSQHVSPVLVLDIDGTLAKYHQHFAEFAWRYWDKTPRFVGGDAAWGAVQDWDGSGEFEDYIGITKAEYREAKLAYRQGGGKRLMPDYPGAKQISVGCHLAGSEVWLATTRPYMRHDSTDPDTRFWLAKHGIYFDHLLYHDEKYEQLATLVDPDRVVMILEDLPDSSTMRRSSSLGKPSRCSASTTGLPIARGRRKWQT
jgi:hypothetical protein